MISIIKGFPLNTNVLALLPGSGQDIVTQKAADKFSTRIGNQLVILIGNADQQASIKAADQFTQRLNKSQLFRKVNTVVDNNQQQAWAQFYYPSRLALVTSLDRQYLQNNQIDKIKQQALFSLYNPMGITNDDLIKNDPFFLFQRYILSLPKPASNMQLHNNHLISQYQGLWYTMINATLQGNSFSLDNQQRVIHLLHQAKEQVSTNYPHTNYLMTGMIFYAKAGADSAKHDISIIGIGSIIGIILLLLITFGSLWPLCFTLFSSFIGFICAFVVTYLIFGSVYLFTLVFGASLIGISVDYAFFYYAEQYFGGRNWQAKKSLTNIFPGITLGLLNVIIAYVIIAIAPFPGLRQLAVFACVGLGMAYLTVICAFPYLLKSKKEVRTSIISKLAQRYLTIWQRLPVKAVIFIYFILLIICIIGIMQLKANDDIRILESVPVSLKQNEQKVKQIIGSHVGTNFAVITGKTPNEVVTNGHKLLNEIQKSQPHIHNPGIAISQYLPSIQIQKRTYDQIQTKLIQSQLIPFLEQIGIDKTQSASIQQKLHTLKFTPVTIDKWLTSPVSNDLRFLWLGKINHSYASVILLSNQLDISKVRLIADNLPDVTFINKADDISNIFMTYRHYISILFIFALLGLGLLLIWRYKSLKKVICYALPPLAAIGITLATLGLFHIPLTLFSLLALILVLGISVDYVIFFAETRSSFSSTMLAVSLSAITTILSFGLLMFSQTPVVHYFGISVFIGITSAFLLSPLASKASNRDTENL
ncbi:MMPL family transporter [Facilibium subflavum]|uniref:MMPL family transporter n=1 Tax=Facilibium subflavum TaxID=2219058 RepID=UPI0013C2AC08|nr:MMPL family transporter [Facilibium subflavum]